MDGKVFLDTNILVYLHSATEAKKRDASIALLKHYACVTSTQALNEFCNVFIKKYRMPHEVIKKSVVGISWLCHVSDINERVICSAVDINGNYGFSFYDCLMIASAIDNDCEILFSEDMNDGQIIDGKLKIMNPYKGAESK